MPLLSPKMPQQGNGVDCGVYVQKYAKYVTELWPDSKTVQMDNNFSEVFDATHFDDQDMKQERVELLATLHQISAEWNAERDKVEQIKQEARAQRKIKKARVEAATAGEGGAAPAAGAEGNKEGPEGDPVADADVHGDDRMDDGTSVNSKTPVVFEDGGHAQKT
jgi:hypothetical protein